MILAYQLYLLGRPRDALAKVELVRAMLEQVIAAGGEAAPDRLETSSDAGKNPPTGPMNNRYFP